VTPGSQQPPTRYRHLFNRFEIRESGKAIPGDLAIAFDGMEATDLALEASTPGTWTLRLVPGIDLEEGDTIAFARDLPSKGFEGFRLALRPQNFNPKGMDYAKLETVPGAGMRIVANRENVKAREIALVEISKGRIPRGNQVILRIGDRSEGGVGSFSWPVARMDAWVHAYLKGSADERYSRFSAGVHVRTIPGRSPGRLRAAAPSDVVSSEPFSLGIAVADLDWNTLDEFTGQVRIDSLGEESRTTLRTRAESGIVRVPLDLKGPGIRWLRVKAGKLSTISNPIRVHEQPPLLRTFWGDIHAHCYDASEIKVLDEVTAPRSVMLTGRDRNMIDVCAASPHFFPGDPVAIDHWWDLLNDASRELYGPGRYVTFPCMEYRGQGGDRNLLFRSERRNPPAMDKTLEPIWRLSPSEVAVLPHVGGATSDWSLHRPILEPSAEVASAHGNFEWFIQEGLKRGALVGVHASSDGHNRTAGHPRHIQMGGGRSLGLNRRDASYGGASLAGFNSPSLDREGIWNALASRNTYGCTGARMLLEFEVSGYGMGSAFSTGREPTVRAWAAGSAPVRLLEIVRDDRLLHSYRGRKMVEKTRVRNEGIQPGRHYYYLRATQADGEIAWSSPIWVTYEGARKRGRRLPPWNRQQIPHRRKPNEEAKRELDRLKAYLVREEEDRFRGLRWSHRVDSPQGRCHYFVGHDTEKGEPIHVKWYTDFPDERLRIDAGWRDYGQWRGRR
jgi:hypothetical protein